MMSHSDEPSAAAFFNCNQLRKNVPNDDDAKALIIRLKQSVHDELEAMISAWHNDDLATVAFHAHRLAAGCLYLGVEGIGLLAVRLKNEIENDVQKDSLTELWQQVERACHWFIAQPDAELQALCIAG